MVRAQTLITWIGPGSGNWNATVNWSGGIVPNNNVPPGFTYHAFIDGGNGAQSSAVTLNSDTTIDSLSISSGDSLLIPSLQQLTMVGTTMANAGRIDVVSGAMSLAGLNINSSITLSGGGSITLSGAGETRITGNFNGTLVNLDNLITGAGIFGLNKIAIVNQGTIRADVPGSLLNLGPRGVGTPNGMINSGTLTAVGGGILLFNGSGGGLFNNASGTLAIGTGSQAQFANGATITGGTFTAEGTGFYRILSPNVTWNGVTVSSGATEIGGGNALNVGSFLRNTGTINLLAGSSTAILRLNAANSGATINLSGGGTLLLSNTFGNGFVTGIGILVTDHRVRGFGSYGDNSISIVSNAPVDADVSGLALTVDPANTPVGYTNNNVLRASGGRLTLTGNGGGAFNNGTGAGAGTIAAGNGGEVLFLNSPVINGGTLISNGSGFFRVFGGSTASWNGIALSGLVNLESGSTLNVTPSLINNGTINVTAGASATVLNLSNGAGTFTLSGGGTLNMSSSSSSSLALLQGSGTLVSDNTINGFGAIGNNLISVISNGSINISGGTLTIDPAGVGFGFVNNSLLRAASGSTAVLDGNGGGEFGGSGSITVDGTLRALNSAVVVTNNLVGAGTVIVDGNSRLAANHVRVRTVSITANATLTINANGTASGTSRLLTNPIINSGRFDLTDNDLIVTAGDVPTVRAQIVAGRHNGAWDTPGLTSSAAKNQTNHATMLGLLSGAEYLSVGGPTFDGFTIAATDTLVKYTWYGDTDFNGKVNFDDYVRIDNGFNNHLTGWLNGDFDLNGVVNFDDYVLIDLAFNTQSGTLGRALGYLDGSNRSTTGMNDPALRRVEQHFDEFGNAYADHFLAAVPEPIGAATVVGAALLCRRRPRCSCRRG
jgi:hypothetical protein